MLDKKAALVKFNKLLNELVAKQAKPSSEAPEISMEVESEGGEAPEGLEAKGDMLKSVMGGESETPEIEIEVEDGEEGEEEAKPELPPELQAMLERALGKTGPKKPTREIDMGHMGGKKVPMAGITATEIAVVQPKGRGRR